MARDDVIAYLESNAETFELPIELDSHVPRPFQEDGRFSVLELDGREQAKVLKSLGGRPLAVLSADRERFASITTQTITDVVGVTRSGQRLQ
jgi:hypothetical protein